MVSFSCHLFPPTDVTSSKRYRSQSSIYTFTWSVNINVEKLWDLVIEGEEPNCNYEMILFSFEVFGFETRNSAWNKTFSNFQNWKLEPYNWCWTPLSYLMRQCSAIQSHLTKVDRNKSDRQVLLVNYYCVTLAVSLVFAPIACKYISFLSYHFTSVRWPLTFRAHFTNACPTKITFSYSILLTRWLDSPRTQSCPCLNFQFRKNFNACFLSLLWNIFSNANVIYVDYPFPFQGFLTGWCVWLKLSALLRHAILFF